MIRRLLIWAAAVALSTTGCVQRDDVNLTSGRDSDRASALELTASQGVCSTEDLLVINDVTTEIIASCEMLDESVSCQCEQITEAGSEFFACSQAILACPGCCVGQNLATPPLRDQPRPPVTPGSCRTETQELINGVDVNLTASCNVVGHGDEQTTECICEAAISDGSVDTYVCEQETLQCPGCCTLTAPPPGNEPPGDEPPGDEPPADEPPADEPPGNEPPPVEDPLTCRTITQENLSGIDGELTAKCGSTELGEESSCSCKFRPEYGDAQRFSCTQESLQCPGCCTTLPPPGDEPPGDEPPGDEPPGDEPPGDEPPGDEPPGDEPPGDEPPGDEPPRRGRQCKVNSHRKIRGKDVFTKVRCMETNAGHTECACALKVDGIIHRGQCTQTCPKCPGCCGPKLHKMFKKHQQEFGNKWVKGRR